MSLLDSMMDDCVILDRVKTSDGVLGFRSVWTDGDAFRALVKKDTSTEARLAEKQGVTEVYTVVTARGFGLEYHDVFRRLKDGAVFRVTANQRDSEAPDASSVQIGKVSAERWELPND